MPDVRVSYEGNTDASEVRIDNKSVLKGMGQRTINLKSGMDHSILYFVRGTPGSSYTLEVGQGEQKLFSRTAIIDGSTKDAGVEWIRVDGSGQ